MAFDIVYFFLSLNYLLLLLILEKAKFDPNISQFFWNYLVGRKTKYFWNNFSSSFFNVDIRVGQDLALSPILLVLYLLPVFYIFEKRSKNLKIPVSAISFVNNRLFISQNNSSYTSNSKLFYSYQIMLLLLEQFGIIIEHGKREVFHYFRAQEVFNLPLLDLTILKDTIFHSKEMCHYLGFYLQHKINFSSTHWLLVRHGSHQGGSLWNGLGDKQTCGTTLALAYVLHCLSVAWSQL